MDGPKGEEGSIPVAKDDSGTTEGRKVWAPDAIEEEIDEKRRGEKGKRMGWWMNKRRAILGEHLAYFVGEEMSPQVSALILY